LSHVGQAQADQDQSPTTNQSVGFGFGIHFLQAYVPKLQSVGGVCQFSYWQKGFSIPSSAAFGKIGDAYVAKVYRWAR
jgi:hypothetical protein